MVISQLGMGNEEWGMENGELGIGHRASGIGQLLVSNKCGIKNNKLTSNK